MSLSSRRLMGMASHAPKSPLVVVIGATGTGKSKLAVDLATRFNGEIINGDAMQMYQGLPIITNKIPANERHGIPHHLLDFIGLEEKPWTVTQFVKESCRVIEEIRSRGKLPIVVGGTHYYTHALLFKEATLAQEAKQTADPTETVDDIEQRWPIFSGSTEEIFSKLQEVDPEMSRRWHPKDRRKIQRSLQIWLETGRKASEVYAEQQRRANSSHEKVELESENAATLATETLRFPTLLLWLEAQDSILKERLNARVDKMIRDGLIDEAQTLAVLEQDLRRKGIHVDRSKGIWVSIGYKEMEAYLESGISQNDLKTTAQALQESVESVKAGTRRYAKRQNRYIRIRLANALEKANQLDKLFLLDCTDLEQWDLCVAIPTGHIVEQFLEGKELPDPSGLSELANEMLQAAIEGKNVAERVARTCEICDKVLMTDKEWSGHLSSRSHKKVAAGHKRALLAAQKMEQAQTT